MSAFLSMSSRRLVLQICMGDFIAGEVIVATACQHVFHKRCCQEWLRQARTCPVCRMDIPDSLGINSDESNADGDTREENENRRGRRGRPAPFGRQDFHHEVVIAIQVVRVCSYFYLHVIELLTTFFQKF